MRCLFSVFFLFSSLLASHSLTSVTENDPSSLVEGVSVITGDLYVYEEDYVVQGAEPISLRRSYVSTEGIARDYQHLICIFRQASNHLCVSEPKGTTLFYFPAPENKIAPLIGSSFYGDPEKQKKWKSLRYLAKDFVNQAPGVSNTASGNLSAHTDLKNQYIVFDPNIDEKGKSCTLYAADGTKRRYVQLNHQEKTNSPHGEIYLEYQYKLVSEELPNGHVIHYRWDHKNCLNEIYTTPKNNFGKKFASVSVPLFNPKKPSPQSVFSGSDGHSLTCHRHPTAIKNVWVPWLISSPDHPDQSFRWVLSKKTQKHAIEQFSLPKGRILQVAYEDTYEQRVKTLSSPVGIDGALIVTHTFSYDPSGKNSAVVDAKGNRTVYFWNDQFRLTRIDRYVGASTFHSSDAYLWEGTHLRCKSYFDAAGRPIFSKTYLYDDLGNVKEERFYGNLSGVGPSLQLGGDGLPLENGVEKSIQRTVYTQDGRNLPLRQEEPNGLVVEHSYHPTTHLVASKFLCAGDQVKVRTFYEYDGDFILRREIIDNGSSRDPSNIFDVTIRTIKEITPKQQGPYVGLPAIIEDKYWDGREEVLLKKTILHYTTGALVEKKEVYDADAKLRYVLSYRYDAKGRLREETNPLGQQAIYKYDEIGNRIYAKDFSGRVETLFNYDFSNQLRGKGDIGFDDVRQVFHYSYDLKHNLASETDPQGNKTTYQHDPFGHRIETTLPPVPDREGNWIASVIRQQYDSAGNEILRLDARNNATTFSYNAYSKPTLITYPDGMTEAFAYNLDGSLKTHTDPQGVQTVYAHDFLGRVVKKTIYSSIGEERASETFEYQGLHLLSKTDAEGYHTTYKYDGAGRKISEERCGEKITFSYDALGRMDRVQEGELVTITKYDDLDRPIMERKESASREILRTVSYEYDAAGNRSAIIRNIAGKEAKEKYEYDSLNRLIRKTDALGNSETFAYNDSRETHQKIHTDPLGLQTIETYDSQGRVASLEMKKEKTLSLQEKIYNPCGSLIYQTDTVYSPDGTFRKISTLWEYDIRGRVKTLIEAEGTSYAKVTTHVYHPRGELFQTTKPDGTVLTYEVNDLGHLISLASSDRTVGHRMSYDRLGRLTAIDGIQRTLDHQGRLLTEVYPQGYHLENRYDSRGRRRFFSCPKADFSIEYRYDALDLKKVLWKNFTHTYAHDLAGNLLEEDLIGSLGVLRYTRDALSRTTSLAAPGFSQEILASDAVGNIRNMRRHGEDIVYTYDDLYQLTSESGSFSHRYSYDSLYNRLEKDSATYEINALNQIPAQFEYDRNGNPIRYGGMAWTYDALDRLIRLETDTLIQTFTYDFLNRCLSKTTNGETVYFLYDGQKEIGALDHNLQTQELRILGYAPTAEMGAAIAIELQGEVYVPIHDIQGNVAALLPLSGEPTFYRYSAFGEERIEGHAPNPWRFSSKRTDSLTHLVNFGRRYYLPSFGRWLTPDPIGFSDGMNLYAFVHNDPLTHFDEYGLLESNWGAQFFAKCAHDLWKEARPIAFELASYHRFLDQKVGPFLPRSSSFWDDPILKGHQFIDRVFGTQLSPLYTNDCPGVSFVSGVLPSPLSMTSTASKISTIARNFQTPSKSLGTFRPSLKSQRYADPHQIRFTQPTISQRFSDGSDINELIQGLRSGKVNALDIPTIRVVQHEGQLMTLDNRRLAAFQSSGVRAIPINEVSLNDPKIFKEFRNKFNYINNGKMVVIIPQSSFRASEEELLRAYGKIK